MDPRETAQANATASATLLAALASGGVREVVFSPGSRSTPLVLAAARHPALRTWPVLDERVAGFLALGLARASGRPVALLCTSGSAGAHWLPALIEARQAHLPLIALTADRPPVLVGSGAGQTIDQRGLFGRFVAYDATLPVPGPGVPPAVFAAFAEDALLAGGPAHLNLPFDEPLWRPDAEAGPVAARAGLARAGHADLQVPETLVEFLEAGRRGVILAGPESVTGPEGAAALDALERRWAGRCWSRPRRARGSGPAIPPRV
ncbi:MAG: thiamine pyrophosphate-binding protein [bacterium]